MPTPTQRTALRIRSLAAVALTGALTGALTVAATARTRDRSPGFDRAELDLPGIPAAVESADVDGDGRRDLIVVVAYTAWADVAEFEQAEFDGVEGLVEVMTVVSALHDRRELRVYPGTVDGDFTTHLPALELDTSLHALAARTHGAPLVALTDTGAATIQLESTDEAKRLVLVPVVDEPSRFAGDGRFYSDLDFLHDLDDDGVEDLIVPTEAGWSLYRGSEAGFEETPSARLARPDVPEPRDDEREEDGEEEDDDDDDDGDDHGDGSSIDRLPEVRDVTGDRLPDLILLRAGEHDAPLVFHNRGDLQFEPARALRTDAEVGTGDDSEHNEEIVYVGDLDDDGRSVAVGRTELERWGDDPTVRQEIDAAKRPLFGYRFYPVHTDLSLSTEVLDFDATGYTFEGTDHEDDEEISVHLPGGFQDLDGDGRQDLVTITLDFSILPLISRALFTQRLKLGMDFHTWCQQPDGTFAEVRGLDLSGTFKINLRNARIRHLSQFAGDFDGDGRADFVQLGRGRKVTIHHGEPGCSYPAEPDRSIVLERKPLHLGFVRVLDLDGDERSDLYVVHPLEKPRRDRSIPTRVDLYLSRN